MELFHFHTQPDHTSDLSTMRGLKFGEVDVKGIRSLKDATDVEAILNLWKFRNLTMRYRMLDDEIRYGTMFKTINALSVRVSAEFWTKTTSKRFISKSQAAR